MTDSILRPCASSSSPASPRACGGTVGLLMSILVTGETGDTLDTGAA